MEDTSLFPKATRELAESKAALAPDIIEHWRNFSKTIFKEGALSEKDKQLIAVAAGHVTQCPYCIQVHTKVALRKGASKEEIMEAIWIAAAGRAKSAYSHAGISVAQMEEDDGGEKEEQLYVEATPEMVEKKAKLSSANVEAWKSFVNAVFKAGALSEKTKQLIALGVSHITQCAYCIKEHTSNAKQKGATNEEMMEAIWVAAEMCAGGAYAHGSIAMAEMDRFHSK